MTRALLDEFSITRNVWPHPRLPVNSLSIVHSQYGSVEVKIGDEGAYLGPVQKELYWQFFPVYFKFSISSDYIPTVEQ